MLWLNSDSSWSQLFAFSVATNEAGEQSEQSEQSQGRAAQVPETYVCLAPSQESLRHAGTQAQGLHCLERSQSSQQSVVAVIIVS